MTKEEGSMYSERLHIPVVLGRISTSANSVEMFQHAQYMIHDTLLMTGYPATSAIHPWWVQTTSTRMQHPLTLIMINIDDETRK